MLLDPLENLRKLDEEIAQLQAQREVLYTFINNHRAILSPSRRIPPDIWRLVFAHCLPHSELPVRALTEAPLLLTRICRSWREIALTTPGLWNAIHINIAKKPPRFDSDVWYTNMRARICGVKRWLENSGSLPLRISLSVGPVGPDIGLELGRDIVGLPPAVRHPNITTEDLAADLAADLLPYSSRWQTLSLNCIPPSVLEMLLGDNLDMSVLKILSLSLLSDDSALVSRLLQKAPNCSILRTDSRTLHGLMHPASFWAHLTQLETSYISMPAEHFLSTLAELCPLLAACTLRFAPLADIHPLTKACEWKHLRKLDMSIHHWGDVSLLPKILKIFNTPFLKELYIYYDLPDTLAPDNPLAPDSPPMSPIHEFLLRSGCGETLTHLTVGLSRQQLEVLVQTLAVLPSLKFLRTGTELDHSAVPVPSVNEHLIQALSSISICPRLEELELLNCSPNHVDALLNVAKTRNLKTFTVNFGIQPEWVDVLLKSSNVRGLVGIGKQLNCSITIPLDGD
ncbi:hypothetical protein E1B28_010760 [Marasmius oreades]|uniref:F-box domain-containing protein n=1 Tax=Marasmius oreades TaxID=181124 RepID=A0A9P7RTF6_9AGAR|nr:uncharacterized protein E1B28_010760 [Marasmius oreades]KAG7089050.1 hypothetical protein E1B28_010760 [Marasmius oreades]